MHPVREGREVRVGLAVRVADLVVTTRGAWRIRAGRERWVEPDGRLLRCLALSDRIVVTTADGVEHADRDVVQLDPETRDATLLVGDVPYAGRFVLRRHGSRLTLVGVFAVEEYLRGVVPWEIGWQSDAALAAVEAQAIAARTYTCARFGQFDSLGFDVFPDERDQVYRGHLRLDATADRAIAATRGLVLECDEVLIQAYYSSTCGGHTAWVERVWPKPAAVYLRGRRDAAGDGRSYCAGAKHFRWTEAWSGADLERTLQETLPRVLQLPTGTSIGGLLDLRITERDASARSLDLEVRATLGTWHVRGDAIRWALRPRDRPLLRSLMFELDIERSSGAIVRVIARGGGNGHGVGMCQMGALEMARRGFARDAILGHYYPGATIRRTY
jgi:stage II sporulation protein D